MNALATKIDAFGQIDGLTPGVVGFLPTLPDSGLLVELAPGGKGLIKSKDRVRDLGEVYTQDREVQAMLNLIPADVHQSLTSRWLEPACGDGNFLEAILQRKLQLVDYSVLSTSKKGGKFAHGDRQLVIALAHIYGVDIDKENVEESRARMLRVASEFRKQHTGKGIESVSALLRSIKHLLHTTIIEGNTLQPDDTTRNVAEYTVSSQSLQVEMHTLADVMNPAEEDDNDLFADFMAPKSKTFVRGYSELHVGCAGCEVSNG